MAVRLKLVKGSAKSFDVELLDTYGRPLSAEKLVDATAAVLLRATPTGSNILAFTSPDAARLEFKPLEALLGVTFLSGDTSSLAVGAYFVQVTLTLASGIVTQPMEWTPVDVGLGGSTDTTPPTFDNTIKLTDNFPLTDDLRYMTPGGSPIENAQIRVYYKADYDAGRLESPVGITMTNAAGRWVTPILVIPGFDYTVQFFKPNEFGPDVATVTAV